MNKNTTRLLKKPWTPNLISKALELDASSKDNFVLNSDNIKTWIDKSGNNHHADTFNYYAPPTFIKDSNTNNFSLSFNYGQALINYQTGAKFPLNQSNLFIIFQCRIINNEYRRVFSTWVQSDPANDYSDTTRHFNVATAPASIAPISMFLGSTAIQSDILTKTFYHYCSNNDKSRSFANGVLVGIENAIKNNQTEFNYGINGSYIGYDWFYTPGGTSMILSEINILGSLSEQVLLQYQWYLAKKWGITLDSNHPYYNRIPRK